MKKPETSALLIELDCLLDTRLTTLYSFGESVMQKAFGERYYTRNQDVFPGVDDTEFKSRYQGRTKRSLEGAMATGMVAFVIEFVRETLLQNSRTPHHLAPKLVINTYPYVLDSEEIENIVATFVTLTEQQCDVEVTYLSIADLTPRYVKRNFSIVVMYEYYKWLEFYSENEVFKTTTCPEVSLIGPALYFKNLPTPAEVRKSQIEKITPFRAMELLAGPIINLVLMPVERFSIALKLRRAKEAQATRG